MDRIQLSRWGLWLVVVASVIGAGGAYRYWRVVPELRYPTTEALWQAVPLLLLALLAGALLLKPTDSAVPRKSPHQPK